MFAKSVSEEKFASFVQSLEQRLFFIEQKNYMLEQRINALQSENQTLHQALERRITDFTDVWHPMMMDNINRIKSELVSEVEKVNDDKIKVVEQEFVNKTDKEHVEMPQNLAVITYYNHITKYYSTTEELYKLNNIHINDLLQCPNVKDFDIIRFVYNGGGFGRYMFTDNNNIIESPFIIQSNRKMFYNFYQNPVYSVRLRNDLFTFKNKYFAQIEELHKKYPLKIKNPELIEIGYIIGDRCNMVVELPYGDNINNIPLLLENQQIPLLFPTDYTNIQYYVELLESFIDVCKKQNVKIVLYN